MNSSVSGRPVSSWKESDREKLREFAASQARKYLLEYARICDPTWKPSAIHRKLAEILQAAIEGTGPKRLGIATPPQHGKSRVTSVEAATWFLGKNPRSHVVIASYASTLAGERSLEARERFRHPMFQRTFPDVRLSPMKATSDYWATNKWGTFKAVGVGGSLTGRPADCLLPGTLVETNQGPVPIERLKDCGNWVKVLAYNESTRKTEFRDIQIVARRQAVGFYRITTASGQVVEATGNHPFYTGSGYTKAAELTPGDRLLRAMPKGAVSSGLRCNEKTQAWEPGNLLLPAVLRNWRGQAFGTTWNQVHSVFIGLPKRKTPLLIGLPGGLLPKEKAQDFAGPQAGCLPSMRKGIQAQDWIDETGLLRPELCELSSFGSDDRREQSRLARRDEFYSIQALHSPSVQGGSTKDFEPGRDGVRTVRQPQATSGASYQPEPFRQSVVELGDIVRPLPHEASRDGAYYLEGDFVAMVEPICQPTVVWNLQVEGTQNFFANGILTHNCVVIDDPFKDYAEAHSPTQRQNVWNWFQSVVMTRIKPTSIIIITQTRWHVDDLLGRLLDPARQEASGTGEFSERYTLVKIPALCEDPATDPLNRPLGESSWPERYPKGFYESLRAVTLPYIWGSLYQGNPVKMGGNYCDPEKMTVIDPDQVPAGLYWARGWDLAATEDKKNDFTAGVKAALGPPPNWRPSPANPNETPENNCLYIAEMQDFQKEWPEARERIKNTAVLERIEIGIEAVAGFKTAYQNLVEVMPNNIPVREIGVDKDKLTRALPWFAMMHNRAVYIVRGEWVNRFKEQLQQFPDGAHDDMVDAVSIAYGLVANQSVMMLA